MKTKVNWINWEDQPPKSQGTYLTYWSDGTVEAYSIDSDEIEQKKVSSGNAVLLHWAENIELPEVV